MQPAPAPITTTGTIDLYCLKADIDNPGYLHGMIDLFNTSFHLEAIQVLNDEDGGGQAVYIDNKNGDNESRYDALFNLTEAYDGLRAIQIPGRSGDWVLWLTPASR